MARQPTQDMLLLLLLLCAVRHAAGLAVAGSPCDVVLGSGAQQLSFVACPVAGVPDSALARLSMSGTTLPKGCLPARVPGTVLSTLLANGAFNLTRADDPYFADELVTRIPDISAAPSLYTYAFVLDVPRAPLPPCAEHAATRLRLELRAASYRVRAWVNGAEVQPAGAASSGDAQHGTAGMFLRRAYELPAGPNTRVLVLPQPPDYIGLPNVGQGGNHSVAKNAALMQCTAGWDWVKAAPDRNTGLWDRVSLLRSGEVTIEDPVVRTVAVEPLHDGGSGSGSGSFAFGRARLEVGATLSRGAAAGEGEGGAIDGTLAVALANAEGEVLVSRRLRVRALRANERRVVWLRGAGVHLDRARLWWPHTHGEPYLHVAKLSFTEDAVAPVAPGAPAAPANAAPRQPSHITTVRFGVRTIHHSVDPVNLGRVFRINGRRIFLLGGNWIATDQLLRYSGGDAAARRRYGAEVRTHRDMGLNLIRVWGGGIAERPEFYDAADELGVLVMQEFQMTGDNNGRWAGEYSWPVSHADYLNNARDTVLLLRPHPSLLFWCGGNELYPQAKNPNPQVAKGLEDIVREFDGGRFYIASSMSNETNYDPSYALAPKDGPYGVLRGAQFFERNPGLYMWEAHRIVRADHLEIGFQPEIGSVSTPTLRSLRRFLSPAALRRFPARGATEAQGGGTGKSDEWVFHKFLPYAGGATEYGGDGAYDFLYALGEPADAAGYAARAQLVQFEQFRALFEGFQARMWAADGYTAVVMWKSQGPWPALRGAFYDWYLAPTAGLAGVAQALVDGHGPGGSATNAHVQLDQRRGIPQLVRRGFGSRLVGASVTARWYGLDGQPLGAARRTAVPAMGADSVADVPGGALEWPSTANPVVLLRLELNGAHVRGQAPVLSRNEYWLAAPNATTLAATSGTGWPSPQHNLTALGAMRDAGPPAELSLHGARTQCTSGDDVMVVATVRNALGSPAPALYNAVQLLRGGTQPAEGGGGFNDERVLPAYYSHNYFTLLPGEERELRVKFTCGERGTAPCQAGAALGLEVHAWNSAPVIARVLMT